MVERAGTDRSGQRGVVVAEPAGDGVTGGSLSGSDVVYIIYTVTVD